MSVGTYLREAREAAGFSVEQISSQTCIRSEVIRDLECEKFISSGGNAYARGHIRTISKIISADTDRLLADFELITGKFDRPIIDLLAETHATNVKPRRSPNISYKFLASVAAGVVGLLILVPTAGSILKNSTHSQSVKTSVSKVVSIPAPEPVIAPVVVGAKQVIVTADSGTTWLSVSDVNGKSLYIGTLKRGDTQSFSDTQRLSITLGNAGAATITVDGKDLGVAGARGEVKSVQFDPGAQVIQG